MPRRTTGATQKYAEEHEVQQIAQATKQVTIGAIIAMISQSIGILVVVGGFSWVIAKPAAQDFILETVNEQIDERIKVLESSSAAQNRKLLEIQQSLDNKQKSDKSFDEKLDTIIRNLEKKD